MPRLYISPTEFATSTIALGFASQLKQTNADLLSRIIFRASARVDKYVRRRIGMPGATVVDPASSGCLAGSTTIPVASTLGFDNGSEQAVIIGTASTREIVPLLPGPNTIGTYQDLLEYAYPFPGFLQLASPLAFSHPINDPVVGCYREIREQGSSNSIDQFGQAITQQAQIASAHLLGIIPGGLSRTVFVSNYPIISLIDIQSSYSFTNTYFPIDYKTTNIVPNEGYFTLSIGTPVYPLSEVMTTYIGGYASIPDDIKEAVLYYIADELTLINSTMAQGIKRQTMGKRSVEYMPLNAKGQSIYTLRAEGILDEGRYRKIM